MSKEYQRIKDLTENVKQLYEKNIAMLSFLRDKNSSLAKLLSFTSDQLAEKKAKMFGLSTAPSYKNYLKAYEILNSGIVPQEEYDAVFNSLSEIFWYLKYQNAYYHFYELYSGNSKLQHSKDEVLQMASFTMHYIKQHPEGNKYMTNSWKDEYQKTQYDYCKLFFENQAKKAKNGGKVNE